jgi:uncharacterized RmlC-like cupin family protein
MRSNAQDCGAGAARRLPAEGVCRIGEAVKRTSAHVLMPMQPGGWVVQQRGSRPALASCGAGSHDEGSSFGDTAMTDSATDWRTQGVRVIKGNQLDTNTAQTPGMNRAAAINAARVGAQKIWAGTVTIHPNAKTGAHHHGALESVIYVVRGKARMRWGEKLEYVAEAEAGDFIYVPPYVPHQEINASRDSPLECVLVRSDNEAVVVNLDIEPVERPEAVLWVDPIHVSPHD